MKRAGNGEGHLGVVIERHERKAYLKHKDKECSICSSCNDRTACNNRERFDKCHKCEVECYNTKQCLKYCDRFNCYEKTHAQISINKKQKTVGNKTKRKDAVEKKKEVEAQVHTKNYVQKNGIKILDIIKMIGSEKYESGDIKNSTNNRDKYTYQKIEDIGLNDKPLQQYTTSEIRSALNTLRNIYSQSDIDKVYTKLKAGYAKAVFENYIAFKDNPMHQLKAPKSSLQKKDVIAFTLEEQKTIMKYVCTHTLVKNKKNQYDNETLRNLILLAFLTLTRIGELSAIDYKKDIDFLNQNLIIHTTLTEDENEKIIIGDTTKTGDTRNIPFNLFDEDVIKHILINQIEIAKSNPLNKDNLLFCRKDGRIISRTSITSIFKRTCREAGVKLKLVEGCFPHMTRHSGITRLIEFGYDLYFIILFSGHKSIREIERTYGHILSDYKKQKLANPDFKYTKNDVMPSYLKELILSL